MIKKLEGKTALITDGTEGIRLATAKLFSERGCLCLHYGPPPEGTRRGREGHRHPCFWHQGDVAQLADLDRLYETVAKVKGRIDIVFGNAG